MERSSIPRTPGAVGRLLFVAALAYYGVMRFRHPDYWDMLDDVNLAIHEAGHLVFAPFGDQLHTAGGSLLQVLLPFAFVVYFARTRQSFASAITLSWVGINLLSVARYVADARAQDLPLVGGDNAVHDWWYLLTEWDLLKSDGLIASQLRLLAIALIGLAAVRAAIAAYPRRVRVATPRIAMRGLSEIPAPPPRRGSTLGTGSHVSIR